MTIGIDWRGLLGHCDEKYCHLYLSAWQDVGIGLYPCNNLTQDDPVCKHIHLRRREDESNYTAKGKDVVK